MGSKMMIIIDCNYPLCCDLMTSENLQYRLNKGDVSINKVMSIDHNINKKKALATLLELKPYQISNERILEEVNEILSY